MTRSRRMFFTMLMMVLTLVVLEGIFFAAGKVLQRRWAMWKVPGDRPSGAPTYEEYLKRRDPVVGWPYPMQYGKDLDVNGAHRHDHFPDGPKHGSCVSLYGDSFTAGGDVSSAEMRWGNVLSDRLSCYVANFGMGGYGTDQAYLRFEQNRGDSSPIALFGIHPDDVLRNLTRTRDLVNYNLAYALKPRFILDDNGTLSLVPIPDLTEQEYLATVGATDSVLPLEHENFQPGGPAGVVKLKAPYSVSVIRNLVRFYGFRSRLRHQPEWMEFLQPGHPLHGLEITAGITRKFVELARQRGKTPLVVILPHPLDFQHFLKKGTWPYQKLLDAYASQSVAFSDFGPYLLSIAKKRGDKIDEYFGPTAHYNDRGNALVAQFVHDLLKQLGLSVMTKPVAFNSNQDDNRSRQTSSIHGSPSP